MSSADHWRPDDPAEAKPPAAAPCQSVRVVVRLNDVLEVTVLIFETWGGAIVV